MTTEQKETPPVEQAVEPDVEPEVTPEAETEAQPEAEPDYRVMYEETVDRAEKAEQRARSIEGSVRSQKERDALLDESLREARKARQYAELSLEQASDPDLDVQSKISTISAEEDRMTFNKFVNDMAVEMDNSIDRSGIDRNDPAIAQAASIWNGAKDDPGATTQLIKANVMVRERVNEHERASHEDALKKAREEGEVEGRKRRERAESTDLSGAKGSGGGLTDAEVWKRYGDGDPKITRQAAEAAGKSLGLRD